MSSKQEILRSRIFQDFLKSGILLLREINSLHLYKSRHKRTLLGGIMKGQSDETDEAQVSLRSCDHHMTSHDVLFEVVISLPPQPLPKRPMESVLSAFLNTTLPLPCRQMNTLNQKNKTSLTSQTGSLTGQTGSPAVGHRERRERFVKAATIGEVTTSDHKEGGGGGGKRRTSSLTDSERVLGRKAGGSVNENNESCETQTETGKCDSDCYENGVNVDAVTTATPHPDTPESLLTRISYLTQFFSSATLVSRTAIAIVYRCSLPFTQQTLTSLSLDQQQTHPLSNTLLSLGTEASRRHCPELWVTDKSTQTGVLTLVGGAIDRFLSGELGSVVKKEQNWMRMLYRLRHNLWVEGCKELDRSPREKLTAGESEERKKAAIAAFRKFLPSEL